MAKLSKHIQVTEETWKWLAQLKIDLDAKSFDEVIQYLKRGKKK
jgi:predicted CopG family antitoxin